MDDIVPSNDLIGRGADKIYQPIPTLYEPLLDFFSPFSPLNTSRKLEANAYLENSSTLRDGVGLHHEVRDAGHDGRAVVAGPVAEDALHLESISISLFVDIFVEFDKYRI